MLFLNWTEWVGWVVLCRVDRLCWWKVIFSKRLLRDVCVHVRSERRHVSPVLRVCRPAATRATVLRRRSLRRRRALARGRALDVGAAPSVASASQQRAPTLVIPLLRGGSHRLGAVWHCQSLAQCQQTSDRRDSRRQPNVCYVIKTAAATLKLSRCLWSVFCAAPAHIIVNLSHMIALC